MNRLKQKLSFCLLIFLYFSITGCGDEKGLPDPLQPAVSELSSITVTLEWSDEYELQGAAKASSDIALAAMPPEQQSHYKQTLIFAHENRTITDDYKHFIGTDSSQIEHSVLTRDSSFYDAFEGYLENRDYLCKRNERDHGPGPSPAVITFNLLDGREQEALFYGAHEIVSGRFYELCSMEFSSFLISLQDNR